MMNRKLAGAFRLLTLIFLMMAWLCGKLLSQEPPSAVVPFDTEHWHLDDGAEVITFEGRRALSGTAYLKGVSFLNGTVEADAWLTGATNFAGFTFRVQSFEETEWFWLRTHKTSGLLTDGIQYAPAFHGVFCWQLRPDGIGPVNVPKNEWVHMKVEVLNDSAALYVSDMAKPVLKVIHLGLGLKPGSAGLKMLAKKGVYFSNFSYRPDTTTPVAQRVETAPPNVVANWQLSPPYPIANITALPAVYPARLLGEIQNWIAPQVEFSGLVNITRYHGTKYHGRTVAAGGRPNYALLRAFIDADQAQRVRMNFGYSDVAAIFLNQSPLFWGNSGFVSRNIAFGGWISFDDAVFLDLKKGRNELLVAVAEDFGGWGFQAKLDSLDGIRLVKPAAAAGTAP